MDFTRLYLGITAACGIIIAACVSGLSNIQCTALADTYRNAITMFGMLSLFIMLFVILVATIPIFRVARFVSHLLVVTMFVSSIFATDANLSSSIEHCYHGTDAELLARLHQRIPQSQGLW